jgi:hypothetical protein
MADSSFNENQIVKSLEDFYHKFPQLPANIREVLVKVTPWISLIFGVLSIISGLIAVLGGTPMAALGGVANGAFVLVLGLLMVLYGALMVLAFPKLQKHQYAGWRLLFWVEVISIVASLITTNVGSILSAITWALIGFYLLFQIKSYYK